MRLTEQIGSPALMWHHIALIFSSGSARLLVDGISVSSVVTEASIIGKYTDMSISLVSNDGNSNAQVAELVIFGRALSTDEIYKLLYGYGVPIEGPMVKLEYGSPGIILHDSCSLDYFRPWLLSKVITALTARLT